MRNKETSLDKMTCIYLIEKVESVLINLKNHPTIESSSDNMKTLENLLNTVSVLKNRVEKD